MSPIYQVQYADQIFEEQIGRFPGYKDDLAGQVLDPVLVRAAWQKELHIFEFEGV